VDTIDNLQLRSWKTYEDYTGPLGVGGLTDIIHIHYGPGIESSERNGWGQWHRADEYGIGMDRTVATGTGYIGQYAPAVAAMYESLQMCPDSLLLFMHHVSYKYVLHSGKTVIQHIYDSHYDGAAEAQTFPAQWTRLHGRIDEDRYQAVQRKLDYQAGHAIVWRDAVCNWFFRESHISDEKGRVGQHPGRIEAESMPSEGYVVEVVTPWEDASGGKGMSCPGKQCSLATRFEGTSGWYDIAIQYFDQNNGAAQFELLDGTQVLGKWTADDSLPSHKPDSNTSTRHTFDRVALRRGDEIRIIGIPDGDERAAVDYIQITPASVQ
jgi:alpha-glucuronidase